MISTNIAAPAKLVPVPVSRAMLAPLCEAIADHDSARALRAIRTICRVPRIGRQWRKFLRVLARVIETGNPGFQVFIPDGNDKLPFVAFSSLPGARFCPGAGACLEWCYSFRAWRYPAAFARQCQNAWLLQSPDGRATIANALAAFSDCTLRLYVDGDFRTAQDVAFWRDTLVANPTIRAYGYSKSLELLTTCEPMPANYLLNLSGGHRYAPDIEARAASLPYARGAFRAVSIGRRVQSRDHGTRETNAALRAAYGRKAFTCPGKCGACLPNGDHACGSVRFNNVDIIIAVH